MISKPTPAEMENMLGELLATILSDGGHYIEEHGWHQAYQDGRERLTEIFAAAHGAHNYRVFYDAIVNRILGDFGTVAAAEGPLVAGELAVAKARTAIDTLQEFRASLLMEYRSGELVANTPEVAPTPAGMMAAIREMRNESSEMGRRFERHLIVEWLKQNPSDPLLELTHSDADNPYYWIAVAVMKEAHANALERP
jgi:hypothetical protein